MQIPIAMHKRAGKRGEAGERQAALSFPARRFDVIQIKSASSSAMHTIETVEGESPRAKVFCIGFHKTGTTSLGLALRQLGYSVTGPNGVKDPKIAQNVYSMAYALAEEYDAFQDNPWPLLYKEMDERYPSSKFILTLRSPEMWINSQVRHFGTRKTPMRSWIYGQGCPQGNEELYVQRFQKHNDDVTSYFRERPNDLLLMTLAEGDDWQKLCPFLDAEPLGIPFPHANRADNREKRNRLGPLKRLALRRTR